jgi:hypothetical protein
MSPLSQILQTRISINDSRLLAQQAWMYQLINNFRRNMRLIPWFVSCYYRNLFTNSAAMQA